MKYLFFAFLITLLFGCAGHNKHKLDTSIPLTKGKLVYDVYGDISGWGWRFSFEFDSANVRINEKFALTASRTKIIDKTADEVLNLDNELSLNWKLKDSFFYYETISEMVRSEQSSTFGDTVKIVTQEFKNILGYECQKTILKLGKQVTMTFWTTDKINVGVIMPGTPLALANVALEVEIERLATIRNYRIKSIEGLSSAEERFKHKVPDSYKMIVPTAVYSMNKRYANADGLSNYASLQYPTYWGGREAVKHYLKTELTSILGEQNFTKLSYSIEFTVDKDGKVRNVKVYNFTDTDEHNEAIKAMLLNMPQWIPGKVRGKPVNSTVDLEV